jgi:ABC-type multidrug transport system ATPase subunit
MTTKQIIIQLRNISKTYTSSLFLSKRKTKALDNVSLEIFQNEIFTLLGPNGSGKTTLLNIIMGQIFSDNGEVYVFGTKLKNSVPEKIKKKMNMCSGNPNFPWCMTVKEILKFYGLLYGISGKKLNQQVDKYITIFELAKHADVRFDELSTGTKQRLALAKSLINEPEILLLDEPTLGLDPEVSIKIRQFIKKIKQEQNITIILTTHYMKEAEELSDRIAFISNGKIFTIGTIDEIYKNTNTTTLEEAFLKLAHL